ncbi:twin-arginine translocase subunit TatC [Enemella evansiae]|uniref:twin-arginine translocase subunit TatC n=1 Tax=Enemella evansiae TaxID=2016499 RepID=UPI000B974022|nr:twin-arginine translocase subunit TatC [Enemella evansiae]OYO02806.1 twin-arginine translocase subunit TatC [Enemella evansiae]OYO15184.1 twin-arginine translocase subunit TatC [Enemella evansiae]OYO20252.1 twin-arginine translocase subunit TatC [Enemella evansiae]
MAINVAGRRLSLAWLKPPPVPPDGNMTLFEHLRELRYRFVVAAVWIVLGIAICAFFYQTLYEFLLQPYNLAAIDLKATRPDANTEVVNIGVAAPMTLAMKIVGIAGLVLTAPFWLYQLWAFIAPGLLAKEKKWAVIFVGAATPLFLSGVAIGYWVMPKGISVMLSFTPQSVPVTNMLDIQYFLTFLIRLMLVFGIAFLLPVVLVVLNLAGILSGAQLGKARQYAIFGCFVFGAVATPSTDPFSMLALALPMAVLYLIAELICRANDRARRRRGDVAPSDAAPRDAA